MYPPLTTNADNADNGNLGDRLNEWGIGVIVPWAGKLWMVNYAAHEHYGSDHKLYSFGEDLTLTIHPESVGGTPAGRFIHRESNQLLIAHDLIDASGKIRVISPEVMPGRITAMARHLTDPGNWIYSIDTEGMIYEANVHTLEVNFDHQGDHPYQTFELNGRDPASSRPQPDSAPTGSGSFPTPTVSPPLPSHTSSATQLGTTVTEAYSGYQLTRSIPVTKSKWRSRETTGS